MKTARTEYLAWRRLRRRRILDFSPAKTEIDFAHFVSHCFICICTRSNFQYAQRLLVSAKKYLLGKLDDLIPVRGDSATKYGERSRFAKICFQIRNNERALSMTSWVISSKPWWDAFWYHIICLYFYAVNETDDIEDKMGSGDIYFHLYRSTHA